MTVKRIAIVVVVIALIAGGVWYQRKTAAAKESAAEAEIETAAVARKDLTVNVSASGVLEALTTVEVKSRGGGEIKRMFVEAGDTVTARQLIAQIDPTQTKSKVDQAAATVASGRAKATQARIDAALSQVQTTSDLTKSSAAVQSARANVAELSEQLRQDRETTAGAIRQAEASLAAAKARLAQAEAESQAQPALTAASVASAQASLDSSRQNLAKLRSGPRAQEIAEAEASLRNAQAAVRNAESTLARQKALQTKGFVSRQAVEDAQRTYDQAVAQQDAARESLSLVKAGNREEDIAAAAAAVAQSEAALRSANANSVQVQLRQRDVEAAREEVKQAEATLANAQADRRSITVRQKQIEAGQAAVRQAEATLAAARGNLMQNAAKRAAVAGALADLRKSTLQLNEAANDLGYTNVYAPRAGVVMTKLAEEGSVVPAGTAALKEGTGLVTIADTSRMFVLTDVDETDMANIKPGQRCEVAVSVLPDTKLTGRVVKIFPQGTEEQNVVRFQVRVQIDKPSAALRPGMTADVTITTATVKNALVVPDVSITRSKGKATVQVMAGGQQQEREVEAGLSNWDETEIKSGLKEGEVVVIPPPPGSDNPFGGGKSGAKGGNAKGGNAKGGKSSGADKAKESERNRGRMMMQFRMRGGK